jgi:hypothetical protein
MRNYFKNYWQVFTCSKAPDQDIAEIGETPLTPALQPLISVRHYPSSALANSTLIVLI